MATSEVWANKVNTYYNEMTDETIRLGKIEFNDFPEAFIKTIRLYNKNANKHLSHTQFVFKGDLYVIDKESHPSKHGSGLTAYWMVHQTNARKIPAARYEFTEMYLLSIPQSKVNNPDWRHYISASYFTRR